MAVVVLMFVVRVTVLRAGRAVSVVGGTVAARAGMGVLSVQS
jgi:hypothetical protein